MTTSSTGLGFTGRREDGKDFGVPNPLSVSPSSCSQIQIHSVGRAFAAFAAASAVARAADDLGLRGAAVAAIAFATRGLLATLRAFGDGVRDARRDELDRANRCFVPRDDEVDEIRIAVGVRDRDDRDAELLRFLNRD